MKQLRFTLLGSGWLAFAVSFFLVSVAAVNTTVSGWPVVWHFDFPGWQTMLLAFGSLDDVRGHTLTALLTFLAALTNLVMLASPLAVLKPRMAVTRLLPGVMVLSIIINAAAAAVQVGELRFGPGYWVWVGGFIAVACGLLVSGAGGWGPREPCQEPRVA